MTYFFVRRSNLIDGDPRPEIYCIISSKRAVSGREIDIVRCAQYGVRLWHEPLTSPEFVFIAAGTLDDSSWAIPTSHIWTKCAAAGAIFQSDALCVEGQPENRQQLLDAFARIHGA